MKINSEIKENLESKLDKAMGTTMDKDENMNLENRSKTDDTERERRDKEDGEKGAIKEEEIGNKEIIDEEKKTENRKTGSGGTKVYTSNTLKKAELACGIITLIAGTMAVWQLISFFREERASEAKMEELRQGLQKIELSQEEGLSSDTFETKVIGEDVRIQENPYESLFIQNDDMAAWLVVEGTVIDYPVMQTMEDENYYLKRDFNGNEDEAGCLILDTDSDIYGSGTTNLIIHGHNMKAGTMFGSLDEYRNEDYYAEHKYMELYRETEKRCYEVMAVFYSQVYYTIDQVFKYYKFFESEDEGGFKAFYKNVKAMSLYDTEVTAELGDNFLTLSTCSYHVEDGRFVVVAKEIDRSEEYADQL